MFYSRNCLQNQFQYLDSNGVQQWIEAAATLRQRVLKTDLRETSMEHGRKSVNDSGRNSETERINISLSSITGHALDQP